MGKFLKFFLCIFVQVICISAESQENLSTSSVKLNLGSDLMSRYIWRGTDYGNSPSIQPTLSLSVKNFKIGCWSSIATNSFYKEIDLYAKYTLKNVSITFTDYYIPLSNGIPASPDMRYFIYDDKKTSHTFEPSILYKVSDKFPLWILGGVFVYGNDKRWGYDAKKDSTEKTYYSSYFEAGYTFKIKENNVDLFIGGTPAAGAYGNTGGIINIGVTGYRKIKISNDFELPVKGSLIFNPQSSNVYFVFGITI
jgi:hypothetical protein